MNIVLMGHRGCGKSTIGRGMAEELWKDFVDTDAQVVMRFGGRTIRDVWTKEGEAVFRAAERDAVAEALAGDNRVIALGGGAVMQPETQAIVRDAKNATRIYLKCTPKELARRLAADPTSAANRPPLSPAGDTEQEIERILTDRTPVYEALADKTFEVTFTDVKTNVNNIIRLCL